MVTDMNASGQSIGIIGAGIGGLAVAVRMARRGYAVNVFEAAHQPGGKIGEWRSEGFRFDTGPSLFTLPELLNEILDPDLQLPLIKLEILSRNFFDDGTVLDIPADPEMFSKTVALATGTDALVLRNYLIHARKVYQLTAPAFIFRSLHDWSSLFKIQNLRYLWQWPRLHAFSTLHRFNSKRLKQPKLIQMMDRFATYNGSDPYRTPATMAVIAHLENNLGAWLPRQGMRSIVDALVQQALRLGVSLHLATSIERVEPVSQGFKLWAGENHHYFNKVISDVDIHQFYSRLLPDQRMLKRISTTERSTSAMIFYWGIAARFPQLDIHNVLFSSNYREEFDNLFNQKQISPDPTIYIYISSKIIDSDAPGGCENWFVMVNAPENAGQDWEAMRSQTRKNVIRKINQTLGTDVEPMIKTERHLDPIAIEALTGSWRGSLYGASSNNRFSAFARHGNRHAVYRDLYFTGGSVHPGGGIPLCLASAKIVDQLIEKELKK